MGGLRGHQGDDPVQLAQTLIRGSAGQILAAPGEDPTIVLFAVRPDWAEPSPWPFISGYLQRGGWQEIATRDPRVEMPDPADDTNTLGASLLGPIHDAFNAGGLPVVYYPAPDEAGDYGGVLVGGPVSYAIYVGWPPTE